MTFAEKLLLLRKSAALSQEELAEKLDVSRQAVSRWEMGTAMPDSLNLLEISRLFNVSADYLLRDEIERDEEIPAVKKMQSIMDARRNRENAFLVSFTLLALTFVFSLASWFRGVGFFGILSCTVLQAALIVGFELGFRRQINPSAEALSYRRKFRLACAWLCTFAPSCVLCCLLDFAAQLIFRNQLWWSPYMNPLLRYYFPPLFLALPASIITFFILKKKK